MFSFSRVLQTLGLLDGLVAVISVFDMLFVLGLGISNFSGTFLLVSSVSLVGGGLGGFVLSDEVVDKGDDVIDDSFSGEVNLQLGHDPVSNWSGIKFGKNGHFLFGIHESGLYIAESKEDSEKADSGFH
jgi:hypothetical protein